jgi:hypothetical protein
MSPSTVVERGRFRWRRFAQQLSSAVWPCRSGFLTLPPGRAAFADLKGGYAAEAVAQRERIDSAEAKNGPTMNLQEYSDEFRAAVKLDAGLASLCMLRPRSPQAMR